MNFFCISDHHGKDSKYENIIKKIDKNHLGSSSVCLGDTGVGFVTKHSGGKKSYRMLPYYGPNHIVLAGNHDDRFFAKDIPNFICSWQYRQIGNSNVLFIPGEESPLFDRKHRTEVVDWFPHEELSEQKMDTLYNEYKTNKPDIIISHGAPTVILEQTLDKLFGSSRTRQLLDALWELYRPKQWIFGHYHIAVHVSIGGTLFMCRPELGVIKLEV